MRLAFALVLVAAACTASTPTSTPNAQTPRAGGTLVHGVRADAVTLQPILHIDITSRIVTDLIYARPARPDPVTGIVRSEVARWEASPDGLSFRWAIEAEAAWSDGTPITAEDWLVGLKSIGRSKRTTFRSDYAQVAGFQDFAEGKTEDVAGVRLDPADPKRWTVRFTQVFCPALTRSIGTLLPRHVFGKYVAPGSGDAIDRAPENVAPPVASGPYRFVEWQRGDRIVLERNARYWKGPPLIDRYVVKVVADSQVLTLQLKSGELDRADVDAALVDAFKAEPRFALHKWDGLVYHYLGWNVRGTRVRALADSRVRRALAHAIDVDGIISAVLLGQAVRVHSHHPPASWAYDPSVPGYGHDPRRAEALLTEAGFARGADGVQQHQGERIRITIFTVQGDRLRETIAQVAAEQLRLVGVETAVRAESVAAFVEKLRTGDPTIDAWTGFWAPPTTDPDPYAFFGTDQIPDPTLRREGNNFGGFASPAAEREMAEGRTPVGGDCSNDARKRRYAAFDRILHDEQPYTFLFAPLTIHAVTADLRGFVPGRFWPEWNVDRWWLDR